MQLFTWVKQFFGVAAAAAGTGNTETAVIDIGRAQVVCLTLPIVDCLDTGKVAITMHHGDTSGSLAATTATCSLTSAADDDLNDQLLVLEVTKPLKRYVKFAIARTVANIALGVGVVTVGYDAQMPPNDAGDAVITIAISPETA